MTGDPRTEALLDDLEAAHAAATPGPWEVDSNGCCVGSKASDDYFVTERSTSTADAALIVAAVNALPDLIARVRAGLAPHQPTHGGDGAVYCRDDSQDWPCNTRRAMTLDEEGR